MIYKIKLQRIQSRALRFITDAHWDDFVTNDYLHDICDRQALNIVWHDKLMKQIDKIPQLRPDITDFMTRLARNRYNRNGLHLLQRETHPDNPDAVYR